MDEIDITALSARDRFYLAVWSLFIWMQHLYQAMEQIALWFAVGSTLPPAPNQGR